MNIPRPKTTAIIQARLGSTRLPGKLLQPLCGQPLILHVLDRVRAAKTVEQLVVATTANPVDAPLRRLLDEREIPVFAGSEEDVLDRFYQAARQCQAGIIVRITPDDPFKDPDVIDQAVERLLQDPSLDYVSNCSCDGSVPSSFPEGLDIEAFRFACLERLWQRAKKPSEREHVTPYLFNHRDEFRIAHFSCPQNWSHLRWTIDYEQDLEMARRVYDRLYPSKRLFLMKDILQLLEKEPAIAQLNSGIRRNEGYHRSLAKETSWPTPR